MEWVWSTIGVDYCEFDDGALRDDKRIAVCSIYFGVVDKVGRGRKRRVECGDLGGVRYGF